MRVRLDSGRCHGHGRCYDLAPDVFDADSRGHAVVVVKESLPAFLESDTRLAVSNCPEAALQIVTD